MFLRILAWGAYNPNCTCFSTACTQHPASPPGQQPHPLPPPAFLQWNPGSPIDPLAPLDIALAGSDREVLRVRLPSLRSADLGVQFKG